MKKMLENKKILVGGICAILLVLGIGGAFFFGNPPVEDEVATKTEETQEVSPEEATAMYDELTSNCDGVFVWDLKEGDTVSISSLENNSACQKDNYYSKMIGYTYDLQNNVILHVNVLKRVDNDLYTLDDKRVGEYKESTIHESLDSGTTYVYTYQKTDEAYKLVKVELMA